MHVRTLTLQEAPKEPTSKWCEIALIRLGVGGAEGGGGGGGKQRFSTSQSILGQSKIKGNVFTRST